jgi:hypothetical protein
VRAYINTHPDYADLVLPWFGRAAKARPGPLTSMTLTLVEKLSNPPALRPPDFESGNTLSVARINIDDFKHRASEVAFCGFNCGVSKSPEISA